MIDLSGRIFGRLTVIEYKGRSKSKKTLWLCHCECGKEKTVVGSNLVSGNTTSCGCIRTEANKTRDYSDQIESRRENATTHGMSRTRTYNAWRAMLDRCSKPKKDYYERYGGRGIIVCERWQSSFENFLTDLGECPPKHELDRKDHDGNYTPENCRWVSHKDQTNNRSSNHAVEYDGKKLTIAQWSEIAGISQGALWYRLTHGWDVMRALTHPVHKRK
jgi:hypothetical protein